MEGGDSEKAGGKKHGEHSPCYFCARGTCPTHPTLAMYFIQTLSYTNCLATVRYNRDSTWNQNQGMVNLATLLEEYAQIRHLPKLLSLF